ncbi:MAG: hypothetical protein GY811_01190 [Myxococcales bacterium]|nr:hypothetical protein [Myxococcales bacterium]
MNKLALSALVIGGLFQATGCIITTDDGDEYGSFDVSWSSDSECPAGASAEVFSQDKITEQVFTDIHSCADGSGAAVDLPLGDYDVWVDITSDDGDTLYAQSFAEEASIDVDGERVLVALDIGTGFFGLTWDLLDTQGFPLGTTIEAACDEVFAGGVDIVATMASTTYALVEVFDCGEGEGVSAPLYLGDYTLVVDVLDTDDAALGTSDPRDETLSVADAVVDLGNFEFKF